MNMFVRRKLALLNLINMFKGKPVELEEWLEAVHIYLELYGQTDDRIMYMVVCQFLSAEVKTWVKNLHTDSWVRLQREMQAYYVDPLGENRAWISLNKLQQTGSVKDYSETFLQLILKVGNVVNEKDKLRRYVVANDANDDPCGGWHRTGELRPTKNSREVVQGSPYQAHQPWSDISVPEKIWPSWQEVQSAVTWH
jgi:hypothetical protein